VVVVSIVEVVVRIVVVSAVVVVVSIVEVVVRIVVVSAVVLVVGNVVLAEVVVDVGWPLSFKSNGNSQGAALTLILIINVREYSLLLSSDSLTSSL
jgi:hypothetical protein